MNINFRYMYIYIENYEKAACKEVFQSLKRTNPKENNLTEKEQQALQNLGSHRNIDVRPADQGDGVVILNASEYTSEVLG